MSCVSALSRNLYLLALERYYQQRLAVFTTGMSALACQNVHSTTYRT
jgi:hypothetical protein